jgi:hypothetical protein
MMTSGFSRREVALAVLVPSIRLVTFGLTVYLSNATFR